MPLFIAKKYLKEECNLEPGVLCRDKETNLKLMNYDFKEECEEGVSVHIAFMLRTANSNKVYDFTLTQNRCTYQSSLERVAEYPEEKGMILLTLNLGYSLRKLTECSKDTFKRTYPIDQGILYDEQFEELIFLNHVIVGEDVVEKLTGELTGRWVDISEIKRIENLPKFSKMFIDTLIEIKENK